MDAFTRRGFFTAVGAALLTANADAAAPVRLQVLVTKSSNLQNVSFSDLRQLFRGRTLTLGGQTSVPFNHPPRAPDRVLFDRLVLNMGPDETARYWVDQKIRGSGGAPRTADSVGALLRLLARLPGAISYVREGFSSPDLKVLSIDGRFPKDSGYPLVHLG